MYTSVLTDNECVSYQHFGFEIKMIATQTVKVVGSDVSDVLASIRCFDMPYLSVVLDSSWACFKVSLKICFIILLPNCMFFMAYLVLQYISLSVTLLKAILARTALKNRFSGFDDINDTSTP